MKERAKELAELSGRFGGRRRRLRRLLRFGGFEMSDMGSNRSMIEVLGY